VIGGETTGYVGVGGGVQVLNEQFKDKYFFTAASSGGSVENVRRMASGEYHTGWAHLSNMYDAWNGIGLFEGQPPFKDMRVLEKMSDAVFCVSTLAKLPIKNFRDMAGKKVCAGPAGSGSQIYNESSGHKDIGPNVEKIRERR
jgi:TRAP transporter TAXI family solute receptor